MKIPHIKSQFIISWESQIILDIFSGKVLSPSRGVLEVLKLIDGKTDIETIFHTLSSRYYVNKIDFDHLMVKLNQLGIITFDLSETKALLPIRVVSVEITEKCNLRCRYCYGAFNPTNQIHLSAQETEILFDALKQRGVMIIELSGGEPTVNPDFDKILEQACQRFNVVTVMTNAVSINAKTFDVLNKYRGKVNFSISIDGFSENTNTFQRDVRNTFKKLLITS